MIYDFNDYNFHVWLVLLITIALISLNLIVPKVKLNKLKRVDMNNEMQQNTRPDLKFNDPNNILLIDSFFMD